MPEELSTESTTKGGPIAPAKKTAPVKKAAAKKTAAPKEPKGSGADIMRPPVTVKAKTFPADNPRLRALAAKDKK